MSLLTTTAPDAVTTGLPALTVQTLAQAKLSSLAQNNTFAWWQVPHILELYRKAYPRTDAPWLPESVRQGTRP